MDRFAAVSANLHSMLMALKSGPFLDHIFRKPPIDMDKFMEKTAGYIQMKNSQNLRSELGLV